MQFSPSLVLRQKDCAESIIKPLLETKYFTRTLQRCSVDNSQFEVTNELLQALSKVQSLTKLNLIWLTNEHLESIINSLPSLETLIIQRVYCFDPPTAISISSPPAATRTLRSLRCGDVVVPWYVTRFVPKFLNLRKLVVDGGTTSSQKLDLLPLTSALPLLTDFHLGKFTLENTELLKNLIHLSSLHFYSCKNLDLSFLTQENSLPDLTALSLVYCEGLSTSSFASLVHAPNLHVLYLPGNLNFNNDCLQYLENMVHLRKLDLSRSKIAGDCRSLKTLMQNLFQLEELNLTGCHGIGNQGAIAGALYSTHSRLRVLILINCDLVDDDLNGIGALKKTLEDLDLRCNRNLANEALMHCRDLVKLKKLNLVGCCGIDDLSPLRDCLNLEELDVSQCKGLNDDSFKVFSEEPKSFPKLRVLDLTYCEMLTEKVFEHLSKNNHLVYQLMELNVNGMSEIVSSSPSARNSICQLKGLRRFLGYSPRLASDSKTLSAINIVKHELIRSLKNLDVI